jgi:hypothetical protein
MQSASRAGGLPNSSRKQLRWVMEIFVDREVFEAIAAIGLAAKREPEPLGRSQQPGGRSKRNCPYRSPKWQLDKRCWF